MRDDFNPKPQIDAIWDAFPKELLDQYKNASDQELKEGLKITDVARIEEFKEGDLEHKDSMGNVAVIKEGDVQVMSAGSGITHSEYNKNSDKEVKFLQIWVIPNQENVMPRYDQISIRDIAEENKFYQVLSPNKDDQGVWIHQDAWFHLGKFSKGKSDTYRLNKE
ncbi:unnamed protein product, partial [Cyprideis torosa]